MNPPKSPRSDAWNGLQTAVKGAIGANEVLFLAGIAALFAGISGIWSVDGALTVCGALLVIIALLGILVGQRKGS